MSEKGSKVNLVDNDELSDTSDLKEKPKLNESSGLLNNLKKKFDIEFNGLFIIIMSIIIFAAAITVAMVLCIFFGPPQIRPHAAISTEVNECTELGLEICRQQGSAVDSAIGSFLCISIVRPDIAGLGGCGSMVIHNHSSLGSAVIDFSCVAPPNAKSAPINAGYNVPESVAIPGVFSGLKLAHKTYGKMNWTTILQLVSQKLKSGIKVTQPMQSAFNGPIFKSLPQNFRDLYQNWASQPVFIPSQNLLNILTVISNEGADSGITGSLAKEIINQGFAWTGQFETAREQKALTAVFGDYSLITSPLPSKGGLDLAIAIELLNKVVPPKPIQKETSLFYHSLIESLKVAQATTSFYGDSDYGIESQLLAAPSIQNLVNIMGTMSTLPNRNYGPYYRLSDIEEGSGSHISIIDSNSLYVSLSVNLGSEFGSGIVTNSGIVLNDAMRLFSLNDTSNLIPGNQFRNSSTSKNIAAPGKRPLNQLTPLVVYNFKRKCGVRFAVGGDHGSRSATGNLQMIIGAIYLDQKFCPSKDCMELPKAGSRPRLYVNILKNIDPNNTAPISFDEKFPTNFRTDLGIIYKHYNSNTSNYVNTINSIGKVQYEIQGFSNPPGGLFTYF